MKTILAIAVAATLTGGAAIAGQPTTLTGIEIETLFAGATMRGDFPADGSRWAERTTKSGRVMDLLQGGKHVGGWFVAGDRMCYIYFGNPPSQPCYQVAKDGEILLFQESRTGELIARATSVQPSRR